MCYHTSFGYAYIDMSKPVYTGRYFSWISLSLSLSLSISIPTRIYTHTYTYTRSHIVCVCMQSIPRTMPPIKHTTYMHLVRFRSCSRCLGEVLAALLWKFAQQCPEGSAFDDWQWLRVLDFVWKEPACLDERLSIREAMNQCHADCKLGVQPFVDLTSPLPWALSKPSSNDCFVRPTWHYAYDMHVYLQINVHIRICSWHDQAPWHHPQQRWPLQWPLPPGHRLTADTSCVVGSSSGISQAAG